MGNAEWTFAHPSPGDFPISDPANSIPAALWPRAEILGGLAVAAVLNDNVVGVGSATAAVVGTRGDPRASARINAHRIVGLAGAPTLFELCLFSLGQSAFGKRNLTPIEGVGGAPMCPILEPNRAGSRHRCRSVPLAAARRAGGRKWALLLTSGSVFEPEGRGVRATPRVAKPSQPQAARESL